VRPARAEPANCSEPHHRRAIRAPVCTTPAAHAAAVRRTRRSTQNEGSNGRPTLRKGQGIPAMIKTSAMPKKIADVR
jgi:hypothetical protein